VEADPAQAAVAAIQSNDAAALGRLLARHPELKKRINDPIAHLGFGSTALLCAVGRGKREVVDVLLEAGADPNARSHWWAGSFGVLDVAGRDLAHYLIERGAVVDAHAAARLGLFDRLRELVSGNPELVHARGGDGQTPLHFASSIEIAGYLLDHGAALDARDIDHESTPAQYMLLPTGHGPNASRERLPVASYLVSRGCRTDILMAAALGDIELVRGHLDADEGAIRTSVSERYFPKQNPHSGGTIYIWAFGWHKTAHQIAREFGQVDVLRLLVERSPDGLKLAQACELGEEAAIKELLARSPRLAQALPDEDRRRLPDAAQNSNLAAVRRLLAAGWPADARGQHGATALHWAAWHGNAEMVREILRYRPPLEQKSEDFDMAPLGWALHGSENGWFRDTGDYAATVEVLLEAGAKAPEASDEVKASPAVKAVLLRHNSRK
jgi:ankyrin repeat protein